MGQYSWKDCCDGRKAIKITDRTCYVLVPKKDGGGHIREPYYDGYGHFGGNDIFDLVAEWNRPELSEAMLRPMSGREKFGGLYPFEIEQLRAQGESEAAIRDADEKQRDLYYSEALERRKRMLNMMSDYRSGEYSDDEMTERYYEQWKREIGIVISCYDEQNAALPYPIKITYDENAVYENCKPSKSDPNQGR